MHVTSKLGALEPHRHDQRGAPGHRVCITNDLQFWKGQKPIDPSYAHRGQEVVRVHEARFQPVIIHYEFAEP